jgi:hypothetical protein
MKRIAMVVVAIALMAVPASALGSSSTCQAYNPQSCIPTHSSGQLPFTGLDVVLLIAGGGVLLGVGFVVRRVSRNLS